MREGQSIDIELVDHLILNNPKRWNPELIEGVFDSYEAAMIQQIPLNQIDSQDTRFWCFDTKGFYLVKSGYKVYWNSIIEHHRTEN